MSHPKLTRVSAKRLAYEVNEPNAIIARLVRVTPTCLRPPYGISNARVRRYIHQQGMQVVTWDLNSFDYKRQSTQQLVHWVVSRAHSGFDLLFHDGGGRSYQTVKALPGIIAGLRRKGLGFDLICQHRHVA